MSIRRRPRGRLHRARRSVRRPGLDRADQRRRARAPFHFFVSYGTIRYLSEDERVTGDDLFATAAAPVLSRARSVVVLEQFAGPMRLGLVVARLAGLTIRRGTG